MDIKLKNFIDKASQIENAKLIVKNCVKFNHNENQVKDKVAVGFYIENIDGNIEAEYIAYANNIDKLIKIVNQIETEYFSEYEIEEDFSLIRKE